MSAQRIVSLLPSATEWVCQLGLIDRLVGVSHECDYPPTVHSLPRVTHARIDPNQSSADIDQAVRNASQSQTPLYDLDEHLLADLRPDLIITQSLCDVCAVSQRDLVRSLSNFAGQYQLLDLTAETFDQVIDDAMAIIQVTGIQTHSVRALESLQQRIATIRSVRCPVSKPKVTLLEWTDPLFCAGHWTPQLIQWAGGDDPIGRVGQPSRVITAEELCGAEPDILLVACCGLTQQRAEQELHVLKRAKWWPDLKSAREGNVFAFDGSAWFNRPGPRLVDALEEVAQIIQRWHLRSAAER